VRGGSWDVASSFARAAYRCGDDPGSRYSYVGFRVVVGVAPVG